MINPSYYHRWTLMAAGYSTQLQVSQGEKYRIAFPPSFHPPTCTSVPFMSSPPDEHHVFVFTCPFFLFPHKHQLVFPTLNYIQNQIIKHYYIFVSKKEHYYTFFKKKHSSVYIQRLCMYIYIYQRFRKSGQL